jgi:TM2 domain-containing membrane protein YozV
MKKLLLMLSIVTGSYFTSTANDYKLDDSNIDRLISASSEYTISEINTDLAEMQQASAISNNTVAAFKGETNFTGYLVRAFFCGGFGIHRVYMGTGDRNNMWLLYTCSLGGGCGIGSFVDFWWPIFVRDAFDKYTDNRKFWVFVD